MAGIAGQGSALPPALPTAPDNDIFEALFTSEGAVPLTWEQASRCSCYTADTRQPRWGCPLCGGSGVQFAPVQQINGLFRSQSRWLSFRREGELDHGEVQLTTPTSIQPGYVDRRVRDRLTVLPAASDPDEGRVFFPAAPAVPFIFAGIQRGWRVQLQSAASVEQLGPAAP